MINISVKELDHGLFRVTCGNFETEFNNPANAWVWIRNQINNNFSRSSHGYSLDESVSKLFNF